MFFLIFMLQYPCSCKKTQGSTAMNYRPIIQDSLDYIEANLKTHISAQELAGRAGFSLYHYNRLFQSIVGMSLMRYTLRRRLLHGIYEMARGRTRIDTVLSYGFDTYAGFYRAFLREFGCTPSQYMESGRVRYPCRLDLSKEKHMIVTHKKASEILKHWGLEAETITDIYYEVGEKNDSAFYVGSGYVLKYSADLSAVRNHAALSQALEDQSLTAAVPIPTSEGQEYAADGSLYFTLTKRIHGRQLSLGELCREGSTLPKFLGSIIGRLHLALSTADAMVGDVDLLDTVTSWALPKAREILSIPQDFCTRYLAAFRRLYPQLPRQIIHRDPNPGNVIVDDEEKWGFIDFDLSERNIRIYDPCYAATAILSETFSDTDKRSNWFRVYRDIVTGYDSVAQLTEAEWEAIPWVILTNQLICVAWFAEQEKYPEMLATNKSMTTWLMTHFGELQIP